MRCVNWVGELECKVAWGTDSHLGIRVTRLPASLPSLEELECHGSGDTAIVPEKLPTTPVVHSHRLKLR